jgi:protease II
MRRFVNSSNDYQSYEAFRTNAEMVKDLERAKRERDVEWLRDKRWLVPAVEKFKRIQKITTRVNKSKLSELQKRERILKEMKGFNKYFDKLKSKVLSRY